MIILALRSGQRRGMLEAISADGLIYQSRNALAGAGRLLLAEGWHPAHDVMVIAIGTDQCLRTHATVRDLAEHRVEGLGKVLKFRRRVRTVRRTRVRRPGEF